jgi:hypothetical protein
MSGKSAIARWLPLFVLMWSSSAFGEQAASGAKSQLPDNYRILWKSFKAELTPNHVIEQTYASQFNQCFTCIDMAFKRIHANAALLGKSSDTAAKSIFNSLQDPLKNYSKHSNHLHETMSYLTNLETRSNAPEDLKLDHIGVDSRSLHESLYEIVKIIDTLLGSLAPNKANYSADKQLIQSIEEMKKDLTLCKDLTNVIVKDDENASKFVLSYVICSMDGLNNLNDSDNQHNFFIDMSFGAKYIELSPRNAEQKQVLDAAGADKKTEVLAVISFDVNQYFKTSDYPDHSGDALLGFHLSLTNLTFEGKNTSDKEKALDAVDVLNLRHTLRFNTDFYWPFPNISNRCGIGTEAGYRDALWGGQLSFGPVVCVGFATDKSLDVVSYEFAGIRVARDRWTYIDFSVGHHEHLPGARLLLNAKIELLQWGDVHFTLGGQGLFGKGNDDVSILFGVTLNAIDLFSRIPIIGNIAPPPNRRDKDHE